MGSVEIHSSPYSGQWYPADPAQLRALLDALWARSAERTGSFLLPEGRAFLVPHAGLVYSGTVAASVYRHIERQRPRSVIAAGFAHHGAPGGVWIPEVEVYRTPLGDMAVDGGLAKRLASTGGFRTISEARVCDHSVEIQIPLLQKAVPDARIVPLYVSSMSAAARAEAASHLAECLTPETVLIASSDLTHFGGAFGYVPFPADAAAGERLRRLDFEVLEATGSLREDLFLETLDQTGATVCGRDPVALMLAAVRRIEPEREIFQSVLDYQTSGEITGDFHHSVSYGAAGYFPYTSFALSPEEQSVALGLARGTLAAYLETGREEAAAAPPTGFPGLRRRAALFVTLHKNGELRGCLGQIAGREPLEETIPQMTLAAALDDPRFDPVSRGEEGITIEISILTPFKRIVSRKDFRPGQHGALLKARGRQGLLLPQVASELGWDARQFFDALAAKAGVPVSVYEEPETRLFVFRAQIIH